MSLVTDDMVQAALDTYSENEWRTSVSAMRSAISAVAPIIAAAERERMEEMLRILDFDGSLDAWANLKGALIDMEHAPTQPPDAVCWNTLNRVLGQLSAFRAAIRAMSPKENSR